MTYRDDLGAATARADALQRELDEARRGAQADRARIALLESKLASTRREPPVFRGTAQAFGYNEPHPVVIMAGILVAILLGGALLFGGSRAPERRAEPPLPVRRAPAPLAPRTLDVRSTPNGGDVKIDGTLIGQTPLSVTLAPGSHRVAVRQGTREQVQHVDLDRDLAVQMDFTRLGAVEIRDAMGEVRDRLAECRATGRFDVAFTVAADGRVTSAVVTAPGGAEAAAPVPLDHKAVRCVERMVRSTRFPRAPRPTDVIFPIDLL